MVSAHAARLDGKLLVLTREVDDRPVFAPLAAAGATLVWIPLVMQRVEPTAAAAVAALHDSGFDDVAFTSANAVAAMAEVAPDVLGSLLTGRRVWVVGPATADAFARVAGRPPDIVASVETAEGLVAEAERIGVAGRHFLLPTARDARPALQDGLQALGATVVRVTTHATHPQPAAAAQLGALDPAVITAVIVASPSAVRALEVLAPPRWREVPLACIGPSTELEARRCGRPVLLVASPHTMAGMADTLARTFALSDLRS
jgi:uroporphyrinogen-III synthase